jgi:radical SAM protein with 4Fe4S-binding SPASM domain
MFKLFDRLPKYHHQPGDPKLQVRMDITNKCNLLCKMCHYPSTVKDTKFDMEPELVQKIVDQIFPHADWVSLACQYEPFMSRHVEEVLQVIARGPCTRVGIVTNATLWSERRIELMLDNPAIETLSVSIDGGTRETYERIRVNGNFDKLVRNLENFARLKRERRATRPALRMNTVLMKSTIAELPLIVDLAIRATACRLECIRFLQINKELDEAITDWESVMPILAEAKKRAHDAGMELFLPIEDPRLDVERDTNREAACNTSDVGRFSRYCEAPWSAVQIYPNGDIHPCGFYGKPFGNLKNTDFIDIWNSEPYLELRRSLTRIELHPKCKICNPHGYDNIERKGRINKLEMAKA